MKKDIKANKGNTLVVAKEFLRNGNKIVNSTSKMRKIKDTKKNWREKVCRLFSQGENPHSKGLFLENSFRVFILTNKNKINIRPLRNNPMANNSLNIIINKKVKHDYDGKISPHGM